MAMNETRSVGESPMGWHYVVHGPNTIDGTASVYRCKIGQTWERCEVYDIGEMTPDELRFLADLIERAKTKIVLHEFKKSG
jgi:hypothetical protein